MVLNVQRIINDVIGIDYINSLIDGLKDKDLNKVIVPKFNKD